MRALILVSALAVSACATQTPPSAATARLAEESRACAQRGGAWVASIGGRSGEYICRALGGAADDTRSVGY
ncbi:MAG: hypothetical protein ACT6RD_04115 [Brevundimonas sp.]|uniref:hypothetical protein n=1 Tax=Brevundimonas sp. TaxID=1871086 RepID=UPI004033AF21